MDKENDIVDYIVNLMISALFAGTEERNDQLRKEHEKIRNKLISKSCK